MSKHEELWEACVEEAAQSYLFAPLPEDWRDMEDEALHQWIEDHTVEWLDGWSGNEMLSLILNSGESLYEFVKRNRNLITKSQAA